MDLFRKFFIDRPVLAHNDYPVLTLAYDRLPRFDLKPRMELAAKLEPMRLAPSVKIEQDWREANLLLAEISFDQHTIEVAGFPSPLSIETMDHCVMTTPWSVDFKELMQSHLSQVILCYTGSNPDPVEQYIALYKTAFAFANENLLGVVNEPAQTAHPASLIRKMVDSQILVTCRQSPPIIHWAGFIQAEFQDELWLISRGFHLFGIPDLAYRIEEGVEIAEAYDVFQELFHYLYFENRDVQPNDAINIDEQNFFQFLALSPEQEILKGQGELLILERVSVEDWESSEEEVY